MLAGIICGAFPNFKLLVMPAISIGVTLFLTGLIMVWGSLKGKKKLRDKILDDLQLQGNERVLDVGCGHGLMLVGAAKRLTNGKATGIDIWQKEDQAGNSPEKTKSNAKIEDVEKKIEIKNADARNLPFVDESFDAVVSSWALHNIYEPTEREKALREILRVTKKGGKIAIADINYAQEYAEFFAKNGFFDVELSRPYFLFVIPSFIVTAIKQ